MSPRLSPRSRVARLAAALVGAALSWSTAASATPPPGSTGFDELPDIFVITGSDTGTKSSFDQVSVGPDGYLSDLLARTYRQSPGCFLAPAGRTDVCLPTAISQTSFANWDHDLPLDSVPIGSGAGRLALANPAYAFNAPDLVRSLGGLGTSAATNSDFAFASEGVAVVAMNPAVRARTTGTLVVTKALLTALYAPGQCAFLTWAQLGDTGPNAGDLVSPIGLDPSEATFGIVSTYLGGSPNSGGCVVGAPTIPGLAGITASPLLNSVYAGGTGLWWSRGSVLTRFPSMSTGLSPIPIDGISYASTSYALRRDLSYNARDTDAAWCVGAGVPVAGCTAANTLGYDPANVGGKAGAVREYLRWVCRTTNHLTDPLVPDQPTPVGYSARITSIIQSAGFSPTVPGRNFGRCRATT